MKKEISASRVSIIALVAILLTAINMRGAVTSLSPLVSDIQESLHLSTTAVGLLGMIPTAAFAVAALVSPRALRVFTVAQTLAVASVVTAVGIVVRVLGPSTALLFAGSVLALIAIGITNAVVPIAVRAFFPQRVPLLSTLYLLSMQVGMTAAPALAIPLENAAAEHGFAQPWRYSLAAWAIPALVAGVSWLPLVRLPRSGAARAAAERKTTVPVYRTKVGIGLAAMFGMTSFTSYTMMMFLPSMYMDGGASRDFAALMLSVWSGAGLLVAFIGPWIIGRFEKPYPFVVLFLVLFLVGNYGIAFAPMSAPWLWVILSGLGPATFAMALTLINVRARSFAGATAMSAFGQGAGYTVACLGPFLVGLLKDVTSGWLAPTVATTIALIIVGIGGYFATRPVYVEDQLPAGA